MQTIQKNLLDSLRQEQAVDFCLYGHFPDLSRTQLNFLVLSFTLHINPLTNAYYAKFGISTNLACYYLSTLFKLGYLDRVKRGVYIFTDQADQLYKTFTDRLTYLQSQPFKWRQS